MSTIALRKELKNYINKADDRLIKLIYAMVQADMKEDGYELSIAHKSTLDKRIAAHKKNPTSGSSWKDAKTRIKNQL